MANLTITIPDAVAPRVTEALAARQGWTADSGKTQAQAAKQAVIEFIHAITRSYEADRDAQAARDAAQASADADITLT
jgi:regulator of protease activity HflC (stomatin/prohibitin superfamily)